MKNLTLENIAAACKGTYHGSEEQKQQEILAVTKDSREVTKGALYLPFPGSRVDGHDFIPQAFEKGAICTLSEKPLEIEQPWILVPSMRDAIRDLAEFYLSGLSVKVIGITGSVGKTSTKEMIASVLSEKYQVLKTPGNFNNEIGLPLTVFGLKETDEIAVLEMGISEFGEMTRLAKVARPQIGVITNIGLCHLENLGTRDGILKAKTEMFPWIKENGTIFLNGDDDKLGTITEVSGKSVHYFGKEANDKNYVTDAESLGFEGTRAVLHLETEKGGEETIEVQIPIPGEHMLYNTIVAAAIGKELGLSAEEIRRGVEKAEAVEGRSHLIKKDGYHLIDDCYNANPVSMKAALDLLAMAEGRKIAVLGDMFELGEKEKQLHYEVGRHVKEGGLDLLLTMGELSKEIERGAKEVLSDLQTKHFASHQELTDWLKKELKEGDSVLIKASHGMEFAKIVKALAEE